MQIHITCVSVFDSWGKLRSGLFNGQLAFLGQYDMCLATHGRVRNVSLADHIEHIHGEYCKATLGVTYSVGNNKSVRGSNIFIVLLINVLVTVIKLKAYHPDAEGRANIPGRRVTYLGKEQASGKR